MIEFRAMEREGLERFKPIEPVTYQEFRVPDSYIGRELFSADNDGGWQESVRPIDSRVKLHSKCDNEDGSRRPKSQISSKDDWEPFLQVPNEEQRLVITYSGPYAQMLEINRTRAERFIKVAGLEGTGIITDLAYSRGRQISGVTNEGAVMATRGLFMGESPKDESENGLLKVSSVPSGWLIEVNGEQLREELSQKETSKNLEKAFVSRFNSYIRQALAECLRREKLLSEKDGFFKDKLLKSGISAVAIPAGFTRAVIFAMYGHDMPAIYSAGIGIAFYLAAQAFFNLDALSLSNGRQYRNIINNRLEIFLPSLEYDRFVRGWFYLAIKGRSLIRLAKDNQGSK